MKNKAMANKGRSFEEAIKKQNEVYRAHGLAKVEKVSVPWVVIRRGPKIVNAFPEGKSSLDFKGTLKGGQAISFDCKESAEAKGLPLAHIPPHQIDYIREALYLGEKSFILCLVKPLEKAFYVSGKRVLEYYDHWQSNKGKRGVNYIPVEDMRQLEAFMGDMDYLLELELEV